MRSISGKRPDRWLTFLLVLKWVGFAQGVIFGLVSVGFVINTLIFIERSSMATGTVVALEPHQDNDGTSFSPVFSYITKDGGAQTAHSDSSSNPPGFEVGETVPVRYETLNPSKARIATFWQTWSFAAAFAIAGLVMTLVGLLFRWRVFKRRTRRPKLRQIRSLDEI